jgi:hypothetical protein
MFIELTYEERDLLTQLMAQRLRELHQQAERDDLLTVEMEQIEEAQQMLERMMARFEESTYDVFA